MTLTGRVEQWKVQIIMMLVITLPIVGLYYYNQAKYTVLKNNSPASL